MQMEKASLDSEKRPGSFIIYMKYVVCVCPLLPDTNMIYKKSSHEQATFRNLVYRLNSILAPG